MKKTLLLKTMLLLCALVAGSGSVWAEDPDLTLDFTSAWTAGEDNSAGEKVFTKTVGSTTYTISGTGGANFKFNTGYFIFGKSGAYINLPKVNFPVEKIEVVGRSGASGDVQHNIFVGTTAASTAVKGLNGTTSSFTIGTSYQAANTQYILKVTSSHNAQVTYIKYYKKLSDPGLSVSDISLKSGQTKDLDITTSSAGALSYDYDDTYISIDASNGKVTGKDVDANQVVTVTASQAAAGDYKAGSTTFNVTVSPASAGLQNPEFTPAEGAYYYGQEISIEAENATHIYYNVNSVADPTDGNDEYTAPLTLTGNMTIKAIAYDATSNSSVITATYTLKAPEVPTLSVAAGSVIEGTSVELTKGDGGSKVVYTTDGTDPTASSTVYSSAIAINKPMTLKAATVDDGNNLSSIVSADYTIVVLKATELWSEDFSGYAANAIPKDGTYSYACANGGSDTKIYTANLAGGESPELLVSKSNGYFQATIPLDKIECDLTLTYKANNNNLAISSTTTGVTIGTISYDADAKSASVTISGITKATTTLALKFSNAETGNTRLDNIKLTYNQIIPTKPVKVTSAGWASFSNASALDFTGTGVTAYIAKANDASSVKLTEIAKVPAETGIVVCATEGTYNIPILDDAADATTGNLLKPWLTAGEPTDGTYYTLAVDGSSPMFKQSTGGTLAAGKAYLVLPSGGAPELNILFDGLVTGVNDVRGKTADEFATPHSALQRRGDFFDLQGRKVANPTKGLYIVNGKKVAIK